MEKRGCGEEAVWERGCVLYIHVLLFMRHSSTLYGERYEYHLL